MVQLKMDLKIATIIQTIIGYCNLLEEVRRHHNVGGRLLTLDRNSGVLKARLKCSTDSKTA
jgi:hypothetical protein